MCGHNIPHSNAKNCCIPELPVALFAMAERDDMSSLAWTGILAGGQAANSY